ncbi:MAG: hypothetical protein Q6L50_00225 [Gloeomargarita sp. GMQP_bins_120]
MFFLMPRKPNVTPVQQVDQPTPSATESPAPKTAAVKRFLIGAVVTGALMAGGYALIELSSGFSAAPMPTCGLRQR